MSRKVVIIGDSWGLGSFKFVGDPPRAIEAVPDTGLDFYLRQQGLEVVNLSQAGSSNVEQLGLLADWLESNAVETVIWFYTEVTRDMLYRQFPFNTYQDLIQAAHVYNFDRAQSLAKKRNVSFILIGGVSPISPLIQHYTFSKLTIESWLLEILGQDLDLPQCLHADNLELTVYKYKVIDLDYVNQQIDQMLSIEKILDGHPNFSDGIHPTSRSYLELADRLNCLL